MTFLLKHQRRFSDWVYLQTTRTLYPDLETMVDDLQMMPQDKTLDQTKAELKAGGFTTIQTYSRIDPYELCVDKGSDTIPWRHQGPYTHFLSTGHFAMVYSKPIWCWDTRDVIPSSRFLVAMTNTDVFSNSGHWDIRDINNLFCSNYRWGPNNLVLFRFIGGDFIFYRHRKGDYRRIPWVMDLKDKNSTEERMSDILDRDRYGYEDQTYDPTPYDPDTKFRSPHLYYPDDPIFEKELYND